MKTVIETVRQTLHFTMERLLEDYLRIHAQKKNHVLRSRRGNSHGHCYGKDIFIKRISFIRILFIGMMRLDIGKKNMNIVRIMSRLIYLEWTEFSRSYTKSNWCGKN